MGSFSIWHWMIVLVIVVLVFGTKKLRGAGGDLGAAVKNFKSSMKEGEAEADKHTEALRGEDKDASTVSSEVHKDKDKV